MSRNRKGLHNLTCGVKRKGRLEDQGAGIARELYGERKAGIRRVPPSGALALLEQQLASQSKP